MDELVKELRKIYIERLTKSYPLERILVFLTYFLGRGFLRAKPSGSLVDFLFSFQLEGIKKLLATATIGDVFIALALTFFAIKFYWLIKKVFFTYLSRKKGFADYVVSWQEKIEKVVSSKAEYNQIIALDIRKKIDLKKKVVIRLHLLGEILLSMSIVLVFNFFPFNPFDNKDLVLFLVCLLSIVLIQRRAYLFYLKELLPEIVSEITFLRSDFSHQKVFADEFSNDEISA